MSTVLTNGIIIPDNGSRNWGGDLANNWNILDVHVGYMTDVKNRVTTLENKVTTLENSTAENTANIQTNASNISTLQTSKQDTIEDLETIRAGATAGATAVQPSVLSNYVDLSSEQTILGSKTFSNDVRISKTINGINPGALSLPNCSESVEVTSQVVNNDGVYQYTNNLYDGWLVVTAFADNGGISNQGFECRSVKSINDAVTINIALKLNEKVYMSFTNFTKFAYVYLYKCSGNA